jgi:hypothetical protein
LKERADEGTHYQENGEKDRHSDDFHKRSFSVPFCSFVQMRMIIASDAVLVSPILGHGATHAERLSCPQELLPQISSKKAPG